jgi:hypothetical protein
MIGRIFAAWLGWEVVFSYLAPRREGEKRKARQEIPAPPPSRRFSEGRDKGPVLLAQFLQRTVAGMGDRDTTCAIVGGIVALSAGRESIPRAWLSAREPLDAT